MEPKPITATKLKATLLGALDEVDVSGSEFVVTKHGRAVAKLVPISPARTLEGTAKMLVDVDEFISPLEVEWDATK